MSEFCEHIEASLGITHLTYEESKGIVCPICMEDSMNRARRTARKRRLLLLKGAQQDPKTFLGRWALKIWNQGIGFHRRAAITAAANKSNLEAATERGA